MVGRWDVAQQQAAFRFAHVAQPPADQGDGVFAEWLDHALLGPAGASGTSR